MEDRFPIIDIMQQTPAIPSTCQWAMFLRNHDELTLEMVTDEDRDYMYRVYAQDAQARINLGIRRRLAPLLDNHRGKIELMNALLFSLPGTPVLYYGDEIGMGDNIYLGDRNGVRTPMQWSAERNAGFSHANPQRLYLPVIIDPEYHFLSVNVETQQNNPHSLLWWTKHLIALRKRFRAFGSGSLEFLSPDNPRVLAFLRAYENERILVVANLSRNVQYVELDLAAFKGAVPVEMLGRTTFPPIGDLPYLLTLGPYACYWFALDWFAPELKRPEAITSSTPADALPVLSVVGEWPQVFRGSARAALEEALPVYLKGRPWFTGRSRVIDKVELFETVPVFCGNDEVYYSLVRITYREGDPDLYALPLGFATGKQAEAIQAHLSHTMVARLKVKRSRSGKGDRVLFREEPEKVPVPFSALEVDGLLFDAIEESSFAKGLLRAISRRRRFRGPSSEVQAAPLRNGLKLLDGPETLPEPVVVRATTDNSTLLAFGDRWYLKVFRRLEDEVNPELEIGRFLTEKTQFNHILPVKGAIEYCRGSAAPMPLAVLQGFVAHQGTAWQLALDALGRYYQRVLTLPIKVQDLPLPHRSLLDLVDEDIPQLAQETFESFLPAVQLLGQRSGELHVALASDHTDPAFAPEPFTALYQRSLYQSVRTQVRRALDLLRKRQKDLPEPVRKLASQVLDLEGELLKRLRHHVLERKISAGRARCHCDFHLSEVLYTGKDFVFIDFEGDPHRPPSARRHKRSPLRDVASMIRSFHYAALTALATGTVRSDDVLPLQPWVQFWHLWVSVAFLKGYLKVAEQNSFLPTDREERRRLLDFFLLKRAANELRFELLHNPDQVQVPLKGLLQLLEAKE
jgi:maltose alpha-D-glucosyltransferase/alpha-amylase